MATPRIARIVSTENLNSETKLLYLAIPEGEPLNFTGGQYVIVNTNISLPGGKIAKRAYSILSSDSDQTKFQICVKKVSSGPGSNYMHETHPGAELPFSGPWGQFILDDSSSTDSAMVIATDTGITAALGLIQSMRFKKQAQKALVYWLKESDHYFIPESYVNSLISTNGFNFQIKIIPPVNHSDRLKFSKEILSAIIENKIPKIVFLSGDGSLLYPFRDQLIAKGVEDKKIKVECFFNNPFKKIGQTL